MLCLNNSYGCCHFTLGARKEKEWQMKGRMAQRNKVREPKGVILRSGNKLAQRTAVCMVMTRIFGARMAGTRVRSTRTCAIRIRRIVPFRRLLMRAGIGCETNLQVMVVMGNSNVSQQNKVGQQNETERKFPSNHDANIQLYTIRIARREIVLSNFLSLLISCFTFQFCLFLSTYLLTIHH